MELQPMGQATLDLLSTRRSVKPDLLAPPGPTADELETILTIAARVPDHKKLVPWRFIVFEGESRSKIGRIVADACAAEEGDDVSPTRLETERNRFLRAPLVIAVISRVTSNPIAPEWEQVLSAGAAAFNLCLAANALGYGSCWITEWLAYNPKVCAALGLVDNERVAGFIHVGTPTVKPDDRERPKLSDIVTKWRD